MCGITGYLARNGISAADAVPLVRRMADTLSHRGPDDAGEWADPAVGVALAFRRLSIIDLSPAGHQPMESVSNRYIIIFNGEVYNFEELRETLRQQGRAPVFRGHSDTEVMLAAFEAWGVHDAVKRFNGMFAIAVWDRMERVLHLIRDRVGVKPLYYGWSDQTLLFGSELKALRAHPRFEGQIDRDAVALFMRHNYVPAPYTIYNNCRKLAPGTILSISAQPGRPIHTTTYWSAAEVAQASETTPFTGTDGDAAEELEALLRDSVALRMIADVPLGVFLSGGIDSSTVTALMQAQSSRPVKTFTIGFPEQNYDEAPRAAQIARHLGTDHTELYVTPAEALAVVPRLPRMFDEPFADSSQIPTHLVSALARRKVTVSLSGDGGDELFGGYNRYFLGRSIWNKVQWMPPSMRAAAARILNAVPSSAWRNVRSVANPAAKAQKLGELLRSSSPDEMYRQLVSHWKQPESLVLGSSEPITHLTDPSRWPTIADFTRRMMFHDLVTYLPDDILTKVDRASMAVSLESREPLLDHRLVEFAWRLPLNMKIRGGEGKWILRQVLYRHVPRKLLQRPKMGFAIPIDSWLRGPLREWAESLLSEQRLRAEGFLDPGMVREKWSEHLSGKRNWETLLWNVLMFQSWLEEHRQPISPAQSGNELAAARA